MRTTSKKRLQILVSNDDGIDSAGIFALVREMKKLGDVTVVAPHKQQSAVGHAITMNYPLRVSKFNKNGKFFGYAVEGTPADCVKLAVRSLLPSPPDLVVSGINHGSNTAINIIYSGTVSAATEGTVLGIPSIAVSLTSYKSQDFLFAAKFARKLSTLVLKKGLPKATLLNVNVPAVPENQIKGIKITRQGKTNWNDTFDTRLDPYKNTYYWLTGELEILDHSEDTDQIAVMKKNVSVTPIHYDLTDYNLLKTLDSWGVEKLR
ncbi:MAG: 5'/3'-nucleotidase SurE [Ignavibacteriae bacterium]|nr:5'/3'-nucleotidase SurE [Ignavibacteriota bacterium]